VGKLLFIRPNLELSNNYHGCHGTNIGGKSNINCKNDEAMTSKLPRIAL